MFSDHSKARIENVALNLFSSLLYSAIAVAFLFLLKASQGKQLSAIFVSPIPIPSWVLLVTIASMIGVAKLVRKRIPKVIYGREKAHAMNLKMMQWRNRLAASERTICGTRFQHWPSSEESAARVGFRAELDQAIIVDRVEVRRIWNVSSPEDARRLLEVLQRYEGKSNHSIRIYFDLPDNSVPELVIVGSRYASASFPTTRLPNAMDGTIQFFDKASVAMLAGFFETLWKGAKPALDSGIIVNTLLPRIRRKAGISLSIEKTKH